MRRRSIAQLVALAVVCAVSAGSVEGAAVSPAAAAPAATAESADPSSDAGASLNSPVAVASLSMPVVASATASATPYNPYPVTNLEPLPACTFGDKLTTLTSQSDWALTLVDTNLEVSERYIPDDLVSTSEAGLSPYNEVRSVMITDLRGMATAAAAAHAPLGIASSYRDYSTQEWTFWFWVAQEGYDLASRDSARPGHSEHQLGLAIDFTEPGGADPWTYTDWGRDTTAGQWLALNAWRYGFMLSYPRGQTAKTCYKYEPWHYRYVGVAEAAAIHASGLTTREWMWRHQPNPEGLSPMATPTIIPAPSPTGSPSPVKSEPSVTLPPTPTGDWPAP